MQRVAVMALSALGLLLPACSGTSSDPGAAASSPSGTLTSSDTGTLTSPPSETLTSAVPSATSGATSGAGAGGQLRTAVARLRQENTGTYRALVNLPGLQIADEGKYRLDPPAADVTRYRTEVRNDRGVRPTSVVVRTIWVDDRLWVRLLDVGYGRVSAWPCFVGLPTSAEVEGMEVNGALPAAVTGLLTARATGSAAPGVISGTTSARDGAKLLGAAAARSIAPAPAGARLAGVFNLATDRFTGWTTNLADLADLYSAAGRPVPSLVDSLAGGSALAFLEPDPDRLTEQPAGATPAAGQISAPAPADRVTATAVSEAAVGSALARCPGA